MKTRYNIYIIYRSSQNHFFVKELKNNDKAKPIFLDNHYRRSVNWPFLKNLSRLSATSHARWEKSSRVLVNKKQSNLRYGNLLQL